MTERVDKAESVRNFYRRQGAVQERERIIKLLEESACCQDDCSFHEELKNMIALIKEENK